MFGEELSGARRAYRSPASAEKTMEKCYTLRSGGFDLRSVGLSGVQDVKPEEVREEGRG
jgi:hypothetical protein